MPETRFRIPLFLILVSCAHPREMVTATPPPPPARTVVLTTPGATLNEINGALVLQPNVPVEARATVDCKEMPRADNFKAMAAGAKLVRIIYPGLDVPLYGQLALCALPADYTGPAARSYHLEIPPSYVAATTGGRISVVFEPYSYRGADHVAWALWLSRDEKAFNAAPEELHRLGGAT